MNKLNFYKCSLCGNVSILAQDMGAPLSCCGQKMGLLSANSTDAATEKHVPEVALNTDKLSVQIGSIIHPMTEEHHITFIAVEFSDGSYILKPLEHTASPIGEFSIPGLTPVRVYEYCNLHSLWVKEI